MKQKWIKVIAFPIAIGIMFIPVFLLSSCAPIGKEEIIDSLLPNLWVFLTHIFASVILITICVWLVWKPTKESLAKRREYIANEIKTAEDAKLRTLEQLAEAEKTKIKAFEDSKKIIDNATTQAYQQSEAIRKEAMNLADKTKQAAEAEAIKIKENMKNMMHRQVLDIAFDVSSALLKDKITEKDTEYFVDEFIDSLEQKNK